MRFEPVASASQTYIKMINHLAIMKKYETSNNVRDNN